MAASACDTKSRAGTAAAAWEEDPVDPWTRSLASGVINPSDIFSSFRVRWEVSGRLGVAYPPSSPGSRKPGANTLILSPLPPGEVILLPALAFEALLCLCNGLRRYPIQAPKAHL